MGRATALKSETPGGFIPGAPCQGLLRAEGPRSAILFATTQLVPYMARYIDPFFEVTTNVELCPETLKVLNALGHIRSAIVEFILVSETVQGYKPHFVMFQSALEQMGVQPHEVLHVGDSDVDDVKDAKARGLRVAWVNRDSRLRRLDVAGASLAKRVRNGPLPRCHGECHQPAATVRNQPHFDAPPSSRESGLKCVKM